MTTQAGAPGLERLTPAKQFRKKPVVIEAHRIGIDVWPDAAWDAVTRNEIVLHDCADPEGFVTIKTLEGEMRGDHGDWLIRGVKGEFYPCKPDIFAVTYEPASPSSPPLPVQGIASPVVKALETETVKARAAAVICEVGALCGWPGPDCKSHEAAEALFEAGLLSALSPAPVEPEADWWGAPGHERKRMLDRIAELERDKTTFAPQFFADVGRDPDKWVAAIRVRLGTDAPSDQVLRDFFAAALQNAGGEQPAPKADISGVELVNGLNNGTVILNRDLKPTPAPKAAKRPVVNGHVLYLNSDSDKPKGACDRNGDLALGVCSVCGDFEAGLEAKPCPTPNGVSGAVREALEKLRSYNEDIAKGRINYRPFDHIQVIDRALVALSQEPSPSAREES